MPSAVARPIAALPSEAIEHFSALLKYETDCWDVHHAISNVRQDFVLLDVRGEQLYALGHLPNAISLPHARITKNRLSEFEEDTLFVVYCAGPHCNGADKAALKLAKFGYAVKKMIGGVTGWIDEGFELLVD